MTIQFLAMPESAARALQGGGPDAYGMPPLRWVSDGGGNPCRHCLTDIPEGAGMLVAAYSPFGSRQPYAETGPVFICEASCERHVTTNELPVMFRKRENLLVRGYDADERIVYGTGRVVPVVECERYVEELFEDPKVAFVHLRSASNNCYQLRAERA